MKLVSEYRHHRFTTRHPVWLTPAAEPQPALTAVKEQLRAVPHKGLHYGLLAHLSAAATMGALPQADVSFNYLGQFDQAVHDSRFGFARESAGRAVTPSSPLAYVLDLNGKSMDRRQIISEKIVAIFANYSTLFVATSNKMLHAFQRPK